MGRHSKNPSRIGRRQRRRRRREASRQEEQKAQARREEQEAQARREEQEGSKIWQCICYYGRILPDYCGASYERGVCWDEEEDDYRTEDGRWNFSKLHEVLGNGDSLALLEGIPLRR